MTSVAARLGLFGAGLVVVFVVAFGVGRAVAPAEEAPVPSSVSTTTVPAHDAPPHDMEPGREHDTEMGS